MPELHKELIYTIWENNDEIPKLICKQPIIFWLHFVFLWIHICIGLWSTLYYMIPQVNTIYHPNCCTQYYIIYLTHWALWGNIIYYGLIAYIHFKYPINMETFPILFNRCHQVLFIFVKLTYLWSLTSSFLIGILYWTAFREDTGMNIVLDVSIHGISALLIFVDYIMNKFIIPYKYVLYLIIPALFWEFIYILNQIGNIKHWNGDEHGNQSAYDALNVNNNSLISILLFIALIITGLTTACILLFLKNIFCLKSKSQMSTKEIEITSQ